MYGQVSGFESVGNSIVTLIVMIRGTFDFWPMLDYQPIFSHFYVYSYYAFTYGLSIALVIAILNNMYKAHRSQMFFKATLDMQDYEMIEFMLKRFKLWTGIQKEKPVSAGVALLVKVFRIIYGPWERSGSVVECLTGDLGAARLSLTDVTALCP